MGAEEPLYWLLVIGLFVIGGHAMKRQGLTAGGGMVLGMIFGLAMGHMVLGMVFGLMFGAAAAARRSRAAKSN